MNQSSPENKPQIQETIASNINVGRDFTFAPQQTYIETQIVEISAEKVTQKPLIKASPYKGLKRFNFGDREYFFGRDALIAKLFNAVNKSSFSLILGASGSGKSSVIRAGLIPELKRSLESQKFYDFILTPNQDPFESLHRCLLSEEKDYQFSKSETKVALEARPDTISQVISTLKKEEEKWFLFIDQFEQLFTICTDLEKRKNFIEGIVRVAKKGDNSIRIVLAMRSDFLEQFSFYPTLGAVANQNNIHLVTEMYPDELRQAIEQPAAKHGVVFEKGLVEQIIKEVEGQSGYLPLLQYTLNLLWERECRILGSDGRPHIEDRILNKTSYATLGGVRGALQKRVDEIYKDICQKNKDEELATKQIFLKLVNIVESDSGSRPVSRRAYRYEFVSEPIESTLKRFIDENLLVSSYEYSSEDELLIGESTKRIEHATIEIAHEILLSSWDKLKRWLEEEKEAIILKNWLAGETKRWLEVRGKDKSTANDELLKGSRLEQIVTFRKENIFEKLGGLVQQENEFIDASVEWRERALAETKRLQRRAIKWLSGGLIVALITAGFAGVQWQRSQIRQVEALSTSSKTLFATDQLASLLQALRAVKQVKQTVGVNTNARLKVTFALAQAVYSITEYNRLEKHNGRVNDLSFSPDGKMIASVSGDGTLRLWKPDGRELKVIWDHKSRLRGLAFSPDGKLIASAGEDGLIKLWNLDGQEILTIKVNEDIKDEDKKPENKINSISFSPDGKLIASAGEDGLIKLWNLDGQEILTIQVNEDINDEDKEPEDKINSISFSPDGKLIASAGEDGNVKVWSSNGSLVKVLHKVSKSANQDTETSSNFLSSGNPSINSLSFAPDAEVIAMGNNDGTVKLWRWKEDSTKLITLGQHRDSVSSLSFSVDGTRLASASSDGSIKLWGAENIQPIILNPTKPPSGSVKSISFNPADNMIVSSDKTGGVRLWHLVSQKEEFIGNHEAEVNSIDLSPDGKKIASAGNDGKVKLWNMEYREVTSFELQRINTIAFNPSGNTLALGSKDGIVKLWNPDNQEISLIGEISGSEIHDVNFSSDGKTVAAGSGNGIVKLWNLDGKEIGVFKGHLGNVRSVNFSPDGKTVASAGSDGLIKLWDFKGQVLNSLWGHNNPISSMSFSSNGRMLASGNAKAGSSFETIHKQTYPDFAPLTLRLSSYNSGPSSGVWRQQWTVKLWLLGDPEPITLDEASSSVYEVKFSHDGKKIAAAFGDETIKVWSLDLEDLQSRACHWIKGYLKNNPNLRKEDRILCNGVRLSAQMLIEQGIELASEGDIENAISKFRDAMSLDSSLKIDPEKEILLTAPDVIVNKANELLNKGDLEGAVAKLKSSLELRLKIDPSWDFDPEVRSRLEIARVFIQNGRSEQALAVYAKLQKLDLKKELDPDFVYPICQLGKFPSYAAKVIDACDRLVELEPEPGRFRGLRGIARVQNNNINEALKDFEINMNWLNSDEAVAKFTQESLNNLKRLRQQWINELRAGKNPLNSLTPEEIEKMSQITPK